MRIPKAIVEHLEGGAFLLEVHSAKLTVSRRVVISAAPLRTEAEAPESEGAPGA